MGGLSTTQGLRWFAPVPSFYVLASCAALLIATFRAWRDEHRQVEVERKATHDWNNSDRIQERRRWIYDVLGDALEKITRDAYPGQDRLNLLHAASSESALYAPALEGFIREWIRHAAALETAHPILATPDTGNANVDRNAGWRRAMPRSSTSSQRAQGSRSDSSH